MKNKLIQIIANVIALLGDCELFDQADWFREKMNAIEKTDGSISELQPLAKEIRNIIAGMGSFSDLSLEPSKESGMSDDDANKEKWELADKLDHITGEILK